MKRVASLYLPDWPIERIVRAGQAGRTTAPPDASAGAGRDSHAIAPHAEPGRREASSDAADFARGAGVTDPHGGGWRPGARWARQEEAAHGTRQNNAASGSCEASDADARPHLSTLSRRPAPSNDRHEAKAVQYQGALAVGPRPSPGERSRPQHSRKIRVDHGHAAGKAPARLLVTSVQHGNKLLIAAAAPATRACGIVPGMAVTQARAQVPDLDIRPADPQGDHKALLDLAMLAARRWCPLVAVGEADGLFLDITGTAHLFGGEARMARGIVRLLARAGFTARVAVADTPGAAWALARFGSADAGRPRVCPPSAHIDLLAPLPTAALRLESRAVDLLKRLGIDTIGQLAALPRAPLARRFGGRLIARLDQATGRLAEPLAPVVPPEHIAVVHRFAEPIATAEAIEHWLARLMPRLVVALAEAGLGARALELVADRIDGVPQRLRIGLARPTRDAAHLLRLTVRRIEEIAPGYGVDALALHVRRADPLGAHPFAETLDDRTPTLAPLIDTLANRIGTERLWRMTPVESDVPERSLRASPPLDAPASVTRRLKRDDVRHLDARPPDHPWHPRWPRPPRLLRRPEAIDHVLVELPDHAPRRFTWRGQTHRVVRADGPERIAGEWWQRPSERDAIRDYFHVEDEAGQRFWLFRRGDGERGATGDLTWFVHGSFG